MPYLASATMVVCVVNKHRHAHAAGVSNYRVEFSVIGYTLNRLDNSANAIYSP